MGTDVYRTVITSIEHRLQAAGFLITDPPSFPDGTRAMLAAASRYWSWKGFVQFFQCVVVHAAERPTVAEARNLFTVAFDYAQRINLIRRAPGMQFGYLIIPCLVAEQVDPELARYAEAVPERRHAILELPVVHETRTGQTHYCRRRFLWGALYYPDMRRVVRRCIEITHANV